jgi:tetratricopeptide (TPR) repeat protein
MKALVAAFVMVGVIAACGGGSDVDSVVAPTSAPLPSPTSGPTEVPTETPTTAPEPMVAALVSPNPTPTFVARTAATPTPVLTPEPVVPTPTPVPMTTFTSDIFDFSFKYPSTWTLDDSPTQVVTVKQPGGAATAFIKIDILQSPQSITDYTKLALTQLEQELSGFQTTSSVGDFVGQLPGRVTLGERVTANGNRMELKVFTAVIGSMGFTLTMIDQAASFANVEPLFDAIADSATFPIGSFAPPAPEVSREVMAIGLDGVSGDPSGVTRVFESTTSTLYAFLDMKYMPLGANVKFSWFQVDQNISPLRALEPIIARVEAEGAFWSSFEPQGAMGLGFYAVAVHIDDAFLTYLPFTVAIKDGAEFTDAQTYVDWSAFLLANEDSDKALYAVTKAIELDSTLAAAYVARAGIYSSSCDTESALADFTKALELDSGNADMFFGRGQVYWIALNPRAAVLDINRSIALNGGGGGYYNLRSLIQVSLGRFDAAIADAEKSLELEPGSLAAIDTRGYAFLRAGQFRNAKQDYDFAISSGFEIAYTLLGGGLANAGLGDDEVARDMLERGLALFEEDASTCLDPQITYLVQTARETLAGL